MKSVDLVFAFRCPQWPSAAREWVNRKRHWPTPETIHGIIQQGCAAVAKGFAGGPAGGKILAETTNARGESQDYRYDVNESPLMFPVMFSVCCA